MKLTKGTQNLGLPDYIKFGIEIEAENVNYNKITKAVKPLGWHTDKDPSLTDSGTECVSPVLRETNEKSVWEDIENICLCIKQNPNDSEREAYAGDTCGLHIHFDAQILLENPDIMKNFLRLWAESEELVYKMCNEEGSPIRKGALQKSNTNLKDVAQTLFKSPLQKDKKITNLKDILQVARNIKTNLSNSERKLNSILTANLLSRNGMAAPIGKKIQEQIQNGNLKLGKPKSKIYRNTLIKNKLTPERYTGLNLTNLGNKKRNTVEFRISNGTIKPTTIKENVFLYSSMIKTAVDMTREPEKKKKSVQEFYKRDLSEEEKAKAFLDLIIDDEEDRKVYLRRWESVKDAPIFKQETDKFGESFKKEDLRKQAQNVSSISTQNMFEKIKTSLLRNKKKEDVERE